MRTYLIDGSNAVRRGHYDPRFPEIEEERTRRFLSRISALAGELGERVRIEIFFDGPRRPMAEVERPVFLRFPVDGHADSAILGSARSILHSRRGVVVVTGDRGLASEAGRDGARVMGFSEFESRLRRHRA